MADALSILANLKPRRRTAEEVLASLKPAAPVDTTAADQFLGTVGSQAPSVRMDAAGAQGQPDVTAPPGAPPAASDEPYIGSYETHAVGRALGRGVGGVLRAVTGNDTVERAFQETRPQGGAVRMLTGAIETTPYLAAGPVGGAALMASNAGQQGYQNIRAKGGSVPQAIGGAVGEAATAGAGGLLSLDAVLKPLSPGLRGIVGGMARAGATNEAATVGVDYGSQQIEDAIMGAKDAQGLLDVVKTHGVDPIAVGLILHAVTGWAGKAHERAKIAPRTEQGAASPRGENPSPGGVGGEVAPSDTIAPEAASLEGQAPARTQVSEASNPTPGTEVTTPSTAEGRSEPEVGIKPDAASTTPPVESRPLEAKPVASRQTPFDLSQEPAPAEPAKGVPNEARGTDPRTVEEPPPAAPPPKAEGVARSLKNATVEAQRIERGGDERVKPDRRSDEDVLAQAAETAKANPKAGAALVDELVAQPRALSDDEGALLLHESTRLWNAHAEAVDAVLEARRKGEDTAALEETEKQAKTALDRVDTASETSGTEGARGHRFRQVMVERDFSRRAIERRAEKAKGEPLTADEREDVVKMAKEMAEKRAAETAATTKAEHDARISALEKDVADLEAKMKHPVRVRVRQTKIEASKANIEKLFAELDALSTRAMSTIGGVSPEHVKVATKLALEHIKLGYHSFEAWAEVMTKRLGEKVKPILEEAWHAATQEHRATLAAKITERVKDGESIHDQVRLVRKIKEHFVEQGMRDPVKLVDAVHEVLKKADPKITRDETMDLVGEYGNARRQSQAEIARAVRDLTGQTRQLAKLRDIAKNQAPKASGLQRDAPSGAERALIKRVHAEMKEKGIRTTDPATELKSALESKKTSLRNRMTDLRNAIDAREPLVKSGTPSPSDAEVVAMEKEHAAIKAEYEEVFGKPGLSDEQRAALSVKASERALTENERRIKENDLATKKAEVQGPDTVEAQRLKATKRALDARNDALKSQIETLRSVSDEQKLAEQIARVEEKIKAGGAKTGTKQGPETVEVAALKEKLKDLNRDLAKMRAGPKKSPEDRAISSYLARKAHERARLLEKLLYEDFAPRDKKAERPLTPPEIAAKADVEELKRKEKRGIRRYEYANRTKVKQITDAIVEVTLNVPKALASAYDASAPLRQGGFFFLGHPIQGASQIGRMFKHYTSERGALERDVAIRNRPGAALAEAAGLKLRQIGDGLGVREEETFSNLAEKIPLIGPGVKLSNRWFNGFLNEQSSQRFDETVYSKGSDVTREELKVLGHGVNVLTGRGSIKQIEPAMDAMAKVLWSPHLLVARFQQATGQPMWRGTRFTRTAFAKEYVRTLVGLAAVYQLAALAGGKIDKNGKLQFGDTHIDTPLSLATSAMDFMSDLYAATHAALTEDENTPRSEKYKGKSAAQIIGDYTRGKLQPTLGTIIDVASKQNVVGEKVTPIDALRLPIPLTWRDMGPVFEEQGIPRAAAMDLLNLFGMGVNQYKEKR